MRDHPFADRHGYVREHRLVYEEYHKCNLLPWTEIHHIDENPSNNDINNLKAIFHKQHVSLHKKIDMSDRKCFNCGNNKTKLRKDNGNPEWCHSKITGEILCSKCGGKEYRQRMKVKDVSK